MMRSLRSQLMVGTGIATTAILMGAAVSLYVLVRAALIAEFDATLLTKARTVASLIEDEDGRLSIKLEPDQLSEFQSSSRPEYFELFDAGGNALSKSTTLGEHDLSVQVSPRADGSGFLTLPDGRSGRAVTFGFAPGPEEDSRASHEPLSYSLLVASDTADLQRVLARIRWLLAIVWGVATGALLLMTGWIIRRGVRPVSRLANRIEGIAETNLSERLEQSDIPAELLPVVARLNGLLKRLSDAFEREKGFTADAAHELRTPLAGLAAALEVCASKRRAPEAYEQVVLECLSVVRRMHRMVDSLLLLARTDASQIQVDKSNVRIDEVLNEAWQRVSEQATSRGLRMNRDVEKDLGVETDREKLLHLLCNLLDNATQHADDGGRIDIAAHGADDAIDIRVVNSGSHISADDAAHVFDRFWRGDAARSSEGRNCGLGLAVCQRLTAVLGGTISVTSSLGGDFVVSLEMPARPRGATTEAENVSAR